MFSTVLSAALQGLKVEFVHVEADVSNGLPMFHLVGYLSSEVKEAGERVRSAIRNAGIFLPPKKIVVNLSPADKRKRGTYYDLPIAAAILAALGEVQSELLKEMLLIGELSLDGSLKPIRGVLPIVLEAKKRGLKACVLPKENQREGALVEGIDVVGVSHLKEVLELLKKGDLVMSELQQHKNEYQKAEKKYAFDFSEIKGQYLVKRAAEIAVAGNHNLLMIGPPGAGKTAIAKRIPSILPPLTREESMELTAIYSVFGEVDQENPLIITRPFREIHQSVTKSALVGGGAMPKPGEISLANKGVLFLDEIAEFQRPVLELLRQPLEEHRIKIIRERGEFEFPAEFILVAAMNPCKCGNYPDLNRCTCTEAQRKAYLGKISQPLLDRIEMCVEVEKVPYEAFTDVDREETSERIRQRVIAARQIQSQRYENMKIGTNAELGVREIEKFCVLGEPEKQILGEAYVKMNLTARTYHKVLCVARTIADLDGQEQILGRHLREALSYRTLDQRQGRI